MKICVSGADGYIGSVLTDVLMRRGHVVIGLDSGLFSDCLIKGMSVPRLHTNLQADVRDILAASLGNIDTVIHLAGLSNDPMGELDPNLTRAINAGGSVRVARAAKQAGVRHLVLASSCSVYGPGAGDEELTELSPVRPLTAYAQSKVDAEDELGALAGDDFRVTALRAATVFGMSPRLRLDLVINELTATAAAGEVPLLRSTGTTWRPFIHAYDLASAYAEVVERGSALPFEVLNVGDPAATTRILDVATVVSTVTGIPFKIADSASPDARNYRVSFEKFCATYPGWSPTVTIEQGIADMSDAIRSTSLSVAELEGTMFRRLPRLRELITAGRVDDQLFPTADDTN